MNEQLPSGTTTDRPWSNPDFVSYLRNVRGTEKTDVPDEAEDVDEGELVTRRRRASGLGVRHWIAVGVVFLILAGAGVFLAYATKPEGNASSTRTIPTRGPTTSIYDRFDRGDSTTTLGASETGQKWSVVGAPFGIDDGRAFVTRSDNSKRTVAVIGMGTGDGSVQATFDDIGAGAGVVFRYKDAFNYWAVTAAPKFGTWNVQKTIDGEVTNVGNLGGAPLEDGTTLRVRFDGDSIAIDVNGKERRVFHDDTFATQRLVGIVGTADDARTTKWDNFIANVARLAPTSSSASSSSEAN